MQRNGSIGRRLSGVFVAGAICFSLTAADVAHAQGVVLRGVSAINEGMAGVAVATPVDSAGALHWNPASIVDLSCSEVQLSMGMILPSATLSSSIAGFSGFEHCEGGVVPVPSMSMVWHKPDSDVTFGLGIYGIGGCRSNYAASNPYNADGTPNLNSNPILWPQGTFDLPIGKGPLTAEVEIFQIAPTIAWNITPEWAIGVAPTLTLGRLMANPLFLAPSMDGDGDIYPTGIGTRYTWGGGFQTGLYYNPGNHWRWGLSFKSEQWCEPFRYHTLVLNDDGNPVPMVAEFNLNYPMIIATGISYDGFENTIIGLDVRYINYANTPGFKDAGFDPAAGYQALGLGWNSVMAVALRAQRHMTENMILRGGYCFNENAIPASSQLYNIASPMLGQHSVHLGASYIFPQEWIASIAYVHLFENSVTGPVYDHDGIQVGTVTNTSSVDTLVLGITKPF